jgi:hypothetical protein
MSFNNNPSYIQNSYSSFAFDPYAAASAPNRVVAHSLYPQLHVDRSSYHSQPIASPDLSTAVQNANQAYHTFYNSYDRRVLTDLPSLNLDKKSIQTLKQIEQRSNRGFVNGILALMIKVLQVVGKLSLGLTVGFSLALVVSALLGLPTAAVLFSLVVASPGMMSLILVAIGCKVSAHVLQHLKNNWVEHSFRTAIQADPTKLANKVLDLKSWIQIKELSTIEKHIRDTKATIDYAQQIAGYTWWRNQQSDYLQSLVSKVEDFQRIKQGLDFEHSMPLLNRFLAN